MRGAEKGIRYSILLLIPLNVDKYFSEVKDRNLRVNMAMNRVIMLWTWFLMPLITFTTSGATAYNVTTTQQTFSQDNDVLTLIFAMHGDNINTLTTTSSNTIPPIISYESPKEPCVFFLFMFVFCAIAIVLIPTAMIIRTSFIHTCKRNRKGTLDIPSEERTRDILRIPHVSDRESQEAIEMVPRNSEEPRTASPASYTYSGKIYRSGIRSHPGILELGGCIQEVVPPSWESLYETNNDELPSENQQKMMLQPIREQTTPTYSSDMAKRPLSKMDLSMRPLPKINEDQNELTNYDTPSSIRNVISVDIRTHPTLTQESAGLFNQSTLTFDLEDDKSGDYIDMSQRSVDHLPLAEDILENNTDASTAVSAETPEMNSTILAERGAAGPSSKVERSNNRVSTAEATDDDPYHLDSRYIYNIEHPIFNLTPPSNITCLSLIKENS